jgi:hypothetical protein
MILLSGNGAERSNSTLAASCIVSIGKPPLLYIMMLGDAQLRTAAMHKHASQAPDLLFMNSCEFFSPLL